MVEMTNPVSDDLVKRMRIIIAYINNKEHKKIFKENIYIF
jgi:hypothetical protein